jgi:hypothetical protein
VQACKDTPRQLLQESNEGPSDFWLHMLNSYPRSHALVFAD